MYPMYFAQLKNVTAILVLSCFLCCPSVSASTSVKSLRSSLPLPLETPIRGYGLIPAFEDLRFEHPVALASPPGETNRIFVVERAGRILVVTNLATLPTVTVFLDLRPLTFSGYEEAGLLGLAFHPNYQSNGFFFVFRSLTRSTVGYPNLLHQQLSRFQVSATDPNVADPASETPLIAQVDQSAEHNGGDVHFGPDGYLYVSFGDTGPPPKDRSDLPQPIDNGFFACVIRIDVDQRPGSLRPNAHPASVGEYWIPPDNPFVGVQEFHGVALDPNRVRTEFYAFGFRNPWRMAFDSATGDLLAGDVGGSDWEEVNLVTKGGNYGWPYLEGNAGEAPSEIQAIPPLLAYPHGYGSREGLAVVGGVVYRGAKIATLRGSYVFGDYGSGNIWALNVRSGVSSDWRFLCAERGVAAFGTDPSNGDVLVANHFNGGIQRLVYVPPETPSIIPEQLKDTGLFLDVAKFELVTNMIPYTLNVPFWSDQAIKMRWFGLFNDDARVGFSPAGNWTFPAGSVWLKHFDLQLTNGLPESSRRIETRVLVKTTNGIYGLSYRWNRALTNAFLVPDEGLDESLAIRDGDTIRTQVWHYPGRAQCLFCHTKEAGFALGFNTAQLNRSLVSSDSLNQLTTLKQAGCFEGNPNLEPEGLPRLAGPSDVHEPLAYRARSYLASNCSQCHQPGAPGEASWDARITTPLSEARLIDAPVIFNLDDTWGLPVRRLAPNSVTNSMVWHWMNRRGKFQMPPIASSLVDSNGLRLLSDWINSFPTAPWQEAMAGPAGVQGYSETEVGALRLSVAGNGTVESTNAVYRMFVPLERNGHLIAHLNDFQAASTDAQAGLLCRLGQAAEAPFLGVYQSGDGMAYVKRRMSPYAAAETVSLGRLAGNPWLRIARQDSGLVAYTSTDRSTWSVVGTLPFAGDVVVEVGPSMVPGARPRFSQALFSDIEWVSFSLQIPASRQTFISPGEVQLVGTVVSSSSGPVKVEFLAGFERLAERLAPPYEFRWTNPGAGTYALRVRVTDSDGATILSNPVEIRVALAPGIAKFQQLDMRTRGNWRGVYGSEGYALAGIGQDLSSNIQLLISQNADVETNNLAPGESALQMPDGEARSASAWAGASQLALEIRLNDAQIHQIALYFSGGDDRGYAQSIEVHDVLTGTLLDRRSVEDFSRGRYLVWSVRGHVRIEIASPEGYAAVLSGIFVGPAFNQPPTAQLRPLGFERRQLPTEMVLVADASDADGSIRRVEFLDGQTVLGVRTEAPYQFLWTNPVSGTHELVARAFDDLDASTDSFPIHVQLDPAISAAEFVGMDRGTRGDWRQVYQHYMMAGVATNLPPHVNVQFEKGEMFLWAQGFDAAGALQSVSGGLRTAATWYGDEIRLRIDFLDGATHQLALYFLDWDSGGRIQDITLMDPATEKELDRQTITEFGGGAYFLWKVTGSVTIKVEPQLVNAVLSGLFFDPSPSTPLVLYWLGRNNTEDGGPGIALRGPPGRTVQLTASTDLITWKVAAIQTFPESGLLTLREELDPQELPKFYRAELLAKP